MRGLVWSAVLLTVVILVSATLMAQMSLSRLDDESIPFESRKWLSNNFGTVARSCYSMFEITFTGRWGIYARTSIEQINIIFAVFLVPYVVVVNFAVMRV